MTLVGRKLDCLLLAAIIAFFCVWQGMTINRPFGRDAEGCASFYGLLARNYFRYPLSVSHGVPVMSMGRGAEAIVYANHPPTTPLLIAAVYGITGYRGGYEQLPGEWQVRLPTAVFSLGCIVLIYALMRKRAKPRAALIAAALFAAIPMTLMFGGFPDVINPQLVFMVLLTVAAYERFWESVGWRTFGLLCAAFVGAAMMDWPAYYLVPVLGMHFVLTRPARQWGWIVGFGLLAVLLFGGSYVYLAVAQHDWRWMTGQIQRRALSNVEDARRAFTFGAWLYRAGWVYTVGRHTLAGVILAVAWVPLAVSRSFRGSADRLIGLLLAWALLHVVVGRQGVFQHEWWWWPLTPGLVIAAALSADALLEQLEKRISARAVNIGAVCALIGFAAWNVSSVRYERTLGADLGFTLPELGAAIRASASPDQAVVVADHDSSLAFWYYADRAVKRDVWDLTKLQWRLNDGWVEATFDRPQHWSGHVGAFVVPKVYEQWLVPPLKEYLDSHYSRREVGNIAIYDFTSAESVGTTDEHR